MTYRPLLPYAPLLACCLLLPSCDSKDKEDKANDKKADAKQADDKKADTKEEKTEPLPPRPPKLGKRPPAEMDAEAIKQFAIDSGDPTKGEFGLAQAFEGDADLADKSKGALTATLVTSMGSFECTLFEDDVPNTVANFVGLARGTRPTYNHREGKWETKKFYDGVLFHRVMENFMVQTGDGTTAGGTNNPGYVIEDEFGLKHKKAGTLSMANQEKKNTGNTQFFVTVKATPHLDGKHAVFGQCDPKVAQEMSTVKVNKDRNYRPYEPIKLESVLISRK